MVEAARKYKRIVQVGMQARSLQHYRKAIELVRGGAIGKVYLAQLIFEVRGLLTGGESSIRYDGARYIGNLFFGSVGHRAPRGEHLVVPEKV